MKNFGKESIRKNLEIQFKASLEDKIDRLLELQSVNIIPNHHFSIASIECKYLYQEGYYFATAIVTQALNEGLIRFIEERNGITDGKERREAVEHLINSEIVSLKAGDASKRILKGFRNDFHHLNPSILKVPIKDIARRNIKDIFLIENEIFECKITKNKLYPKQHKYWDIKPNGATEILFK